MLSVFPAPDSPLRHNQVSDVSLGPSEEQSCISEAHAQVTLKLLREGTQVLLRSGSRALT